MDAPNYVQGLYTVAQRDAIFAKAAKYPDASDGLLNQVPTIFPGGTIGWRQIPEGGDGTANANIAAIESTQYASRDYAVNDLLIYNDQLYRVTAPIAAGGTITPETNVVSTTVAFWAPESFVPLVGKGVNLLDNPYFIGGGTAGAFPVNQRGQTGASAYPNYGVTIDRWSSNGGTVGVLSDRITLSGFNSGGQLYQYVKNYAAYKGKDLTFSALGSSSDGNSYHISIYDGISYATGDMYLPASKGLASVTFTISPNATALVVQIINLVPGATCSLEAVKLELGTQQTLARQVNGSWVLNDPPPNYGEELARCQRYFQVFRTQALRPTYGIDFRPPMATDAPTLGSFTLDNVTYYTASSET